MELPNGGKVVIVDDCRSEIEPLIDILSNKNIPILYFSGLEESLPTSPLTGVRVVFLDLRFSTNTDEKTIVGNAGGVLKRLISNENGPFLLITWSSTGDEHIEALREVLEKTKVFPEAIVSLSKSDYFTTEAVDIESNMSTIRSIIAEDNDVDTVTENKMVKKLETYLFSGTDENKKVFQKETYNKLVSAIDESIQKAGILPLFVVWENSIQTAAAKTLTNIYGVVPDGIKPEKRLRAVVNSLSRYVLEQRYGNATKEERLQAAFSELNDLFTYFFEAESSDIEKKIKVELENGNEFDLKPYSTKMNTWKMVRFVGKDEAPGRIYLDRNKLFRWSSFADSGDEENIKNFQKKIDEMIDLDDSTVYVYMNINGECETAQKKAKLMKIVPGIIVDKPYFDSQFGIGKYDKRDDLMVFRPFQFKSETDKEDSCGDKYLIFSLNQCTNIEFSEVSEESLFLLNRRYYSQVRHKIADNFFKEGLDLYK